MGALKWVLKATLCNVRTIVHNCALLWAFWAPFWRNFRRKMTTIVANRGKLWISTLSPHLSAPIQTFLTWKLPSEKKNKFCTTCRKIGLFWGGSCMADKVCQDVTLFSETWMSCHPLSLSLSFSLFVLFFDLLAIRRPAFRGRESGRLARNRFARIASPQTSENWRRLWLFLVGKSLRGGGQNVPCDLGGETCCRVPPPKPVLEFWMPQKVGFVWSVPVSYKENDRVWTNGGGTYLSGGGVPTRKDLWYVFHSSEFSTPLCFSLI